MEDQLAKIIARLELMAEEMRVKTIEDKIRRAAYEEKERLRKLIEERQKLEISSFQKAMKDAIRWHETKAFRNYIDHVEQKALAAEKPDEETFAWVQWARGKADWYDPLIEKEDEWMAGIDRNSIMKSDPPRVGSYGIGTSGETSAPNKPAWPLLQWYVKNRG